MNVYSFANRGFDTIVSTAFEQDLGNVACSYCGQCASVCPTGAIVERDDTEKFGTLLTTQIKSLLCRPRLPCALPLAKNWAWNPAAL